MVNVVNISNDVLQSFLQGFFVCTVMCVEKVVNDFMCIRRFDFSTHGDEGNKADGEIVASSTKVGGKIGASSTKVGGKLLLSPPKLVENCR